jgi:hypothetical protein
MTETRPARTVPIWDAPITVGLLAVGVINTVQAVAQARDLPAVLDRIYQARGISGYTPVDTATGIGWAMVVAAIGSLVLAIGFSVPRIRDHRLAFWIPLAAGAASVVVTGVLVMAAILADPSYLDSIRQLPSTP